MPRKKGDKAKLSPTDKEVIIQTFAVTANKTETARRCGVSLGSVVRILKAAEDEGGDVTKARAEAAVKLANKMHVKAEELVDSISETDIESGRIPIRNADGDLTGYKYYGPSLLQKATAAGILTDKANVIQSYEKGLNQDSRSGHLMLPQDQTGLIGAINSKIKELSVLNIRFEDDNPDLVRQTQEIVAEVEAIEEREANRPEVVTFDEFDN